MNIINRKLASKLAVVATSVVLLAGCAQTATKPENAVVNLVQETESAAKSLASGIDLKNGKPVLTVSFADIDNLRNSSTLGRILGEQFSSAMTNLGVPMIEVKMRNDLFVEAQTGELILSRELRSIVDAHNAQAVVVGTYAIGGENIYVTARVVRTEDNIVLSSTNYTMPINKDIRAMVRTRR